MCIFGICINAIVFFVIWSTFGWSQVGSYKIKLVGYMVFLFFRLYGAFSEDKTMHHTSGTHCTFKYGPFPSVFILTFSPCLALSQSSGRNYR